MADRIYGIDLGTTYSCIAYVDEHMKPVVVPNSEGQPTTPSVVYFENPDNIVVGSHAKDVAELFPEQVVSTVKRAMGDPNWLNEQDGKTYHPQDVSSFILRKLVKDAGIKTGDTITDVVITCPAYFGAPQREATRQAGELANLNVHYVVPEPTAAAIAHSIDQSEDQNILVYDLGGGTFDVTVLSVKAGAIEVVCTGGDHMLGGKNWDETIAGWFAEQFSKEKGVDAKQLTDHPDSWQDLLKSAEAAKVALSTKTAHTLKVQHEVGRVLVKLTRDKFDELTGRLLERTLSLTEELLKTAEDKGCSTIDKLLLVGGSTFMPQVKTAVEARFSFEVSWFDPNEAVAKGAALMGLKCQLNKNFEEWVKKEIARKTGKDVADVTEEEFKTAAEDRDLRDRGEQKLAGDHRMSLPVIQHLSRKTIRNVTSKSFGVVVRVKADGREEERVNNLIVIDDAVPKSALGKYVTFEAGQRGLTIICVENDERVGPGDNIEYDRSQVIGKTELMFTKPLPEGSPVEIRFSLADDGRLDVHGKDLTTHQEIDAVFKSDAVLTVDEIKKKKSRNMGIAVT